MLVLSRKVEQSLKIGRDVIVRVLGIDGDRVKLGIEAPRSYEVRRGEHVGDPDPQPGAPDEGSCEQPAPALDSP